MISTNLNVAEILEILKDKLSDKIGMSFAALPSRLVY
jgi:hypothetical protein